MFNSYSSSTSCVKNNFRVNAVSGNLVKNHPKSWFERFNLESRRAELLFQEGGHKATKQKYVTYEYSGREHLTNVEIPKKDIIVLQAMVCGDMEVLCECIYREDFEAVEEVGVPNEGV